LSLEQKLFTYLRKLHASSSGAKNRAIAQCDRGEMPQSHTKGDQIMARKYSKSASKDVESAMRRKKKGTLKSGPGGKAGKVKSRKQAIAIGLSEARAKGKKVPSKKKARKKK